MATSVPSLPDPSDPRTVASSWAWAQLAAPEPYRTSRFLPPTSDRSGLILLVDGMPAPGRERVWSRMISELQKSGFKIAARASAPTSGADDGAVEVVAVFCDDRKDRELFDAVWVEAIAAEGAE